MFVAVIRWEFKLKPVYPTRRFVCLSDPAEYRELEHDPTATSAWYVNDRWGFDAADRKTFELVDFTVNGESAAIRRTTKKGGQTYSVSLGDVAMRATNPVVIAYTYRTLVAVGGNLLRLRVDQPTHGLAVTLDYTDTDLQNISVLDYIASGDRVSVKPSAPELPERTVEIDFDGWVLPRSGVAFV